MFNSKKRLQRRVAEVFDAELQERTSWLGIAPETPAATGSLLDGWPRSSSSDRTALATPTFYRGCDWIATSIASFQLEAWRGPERLEPQPSVLRRPDPFSQAFDFWSQCVYSLLLRGNLYLLTESVNELGRPASVRILNPDTITAQLSAPTFDRRTISFKMNGVTIPKDLMTHVPMIVLPGRATGLGPIEAASSTFLGGKTATDAVNSNFTKGVYPSGVITHPTALSKERADELRDQFVEANAGINNRRPVVMSGGTTFTTQQMTSRDAQWIEARDLTIADVARLLGIPFAMLGIPVAGSSLTYTNRAHVATDYLRNALQPILSRLASAAESWLPTTQRARWDVSEFLRPDPQARIDLYNTALGGQAWLTPDEVRTFEAANAAGGFAVIGGEDSAPFTDPFVSPVAPDIAPRTEAPNG